MLKRTSLKEQKQLAKDIGKVQKTLFYCILDLEKHFNQRDCKQPDMPVTLIVWFEIFFLLYFESAYRYP